MRIERSIFCIGAAAHGNDIRGWRIVIIGCGETWGMKITRIYTDESGASHFDEHEENGVETRNNAEYTRAIDAYGLVFKESKPLGDEPC